MEYHYIIQPTHKIVGEIQVPGDKSISHRAIMLASLAQGICHIDGFLPSEDCLATLAAFRAMGVAIERPDPVHLIIHGVGLNGLRQPDHILDLGNSGTAIRLLAGLLAGVRICAVLTGDESLRSRPMNRIIKPLSLMGAKIKSALGGKAPLEICSSEPLHGINYSLPVASAQIKSCLLLAGLNAEGETFISQPLPCRDHTERMLQSFGVKIDYDETSVKINGKQSWQSLDITIPGDISSAAFFMVAAAIVPDSEIFLTHVGINPTRTGIIHLLQQMGAHIEIVDHHFHGAEPCATIYVKYAPLKGITINPKWVPATIDELPALMIAAAAASGTTHLRGAKELRVKESDRLHAMAKGLSDLGIQVEEYEDGLSLAGGKFSGGIINSFGDHRIAMAFSMAALIAKESITVQNCSNVATSFPNFVELGQKLGLKIAVIEA